MSEETEKSLKVLSSLLEECRLLQSTHAKLVLIFDGVEPGNGFELIVSTFDSGCTPPIKLDVQSMCAEDENDEIGRRRRKILLAPLINHISWLYAHKMRQANAYMGGLIASLPALPPEKA